MTADEVEAYLERVTYRPGWLLRLRDMRDFRPGGSFSLIVEGPAENSHHPGRRVSVMHNFPLMPLGRLTEERLLHEVRHDLGRIELHERDEWLRVDGALPFDPHREGAG